MLVNTEIVDVFLEYGSAENCRDHWIFHEINPGKFIFEDPPETQSQKVKMIYDNCFSIINDFRPMNYCLWEEIFGEFTGMPEDLIIYLIVGAPNPYDAMVRSEPDGKTAIIFDLYRMSTYHTDELEDLLIKMITHELAHVFIKQNYSYPKKNHENFMEILKLIMFDEGLAHLLSFRENVLNINWESNEYLKRKEKAYYRLRQVIQTFREHNQKELLIEATTGVYWEKYGAMSGMFSIVDYLKKNDMDLKSLDILYSKGPGFLWDKWSEDNFVQ
jgi:hypothetical protein